MRRLDLSTSSFGRREVIGGLALAGAAAGGIGFAPAVALSDDGDVTGTIRGDKVVRIATGRIIHRFFDTSPISPSGRYMALTRFPYEGRSPQAGDASEVVLVDLATRRERVVATTRGWEMQLGAQVQWGSDDAHLLFNDVDPATWRVQTVVLDPLTGRRRLLDGPLFMASADGRRLVGYDLRTSRFAQVGYGVIVPDAVATRVYGPSETNGVYVTDVATGRSRMIVSSREIYERTVPSIRIADPEGYEFYVFQAKWNPQGSRILISFQWTPRGGGTRGRSVVTMRSDGSDLRTAITDAQWSRGGHHVNWMPDGEHLSMNLNVDAKPGIEIIAVRYDGTGLRTLYDPGSGHPSMHPAGLPLMVTDSYPNEPVALGRGVVPIRLIDLETRTERHVAEVYVSTTEGEHRIDPHPAWDRSGRYVTFNGFVGGTRNVWMVDVGEHVAAVRKRVAAPA